MANPIYPAFRVAALLAVLASPSALAALCTNDLPLTTFAAPDAACGTRGPEAALARWGLGCNGGFYNYMVTYAHVERAQTPSPWQSGRAFSPESGSCASEQACAEQYKGLKTAERLKALWENKKDARGWSAAEKKEFAEKAYAQYKLDVPPYMAAEAGYEKALKACEAFEAAAAGYEQKAQDFFSAERDYILQAGAVTDEAMKRLGQCTGLKRSCLSPYKTNVAAWEQAVRNEFAKRLEAQGKPAAEATAAASAALAKKQANVAEGGAQVVAQAMDGSRPGAQVPQPAQGGVVIGGLGANAKVKTEQELDDELHEKMTGAFEARMKPTTVGKEVIDNTKAPTFRLEAMGDSTRGQYDYTDGSLKLNHKKVAAIIVQEDPKAKDASLNTPGEVRDYLLKDPVMRDRIAQHYEVTYVHERTHAWQAQEIDEKGMRAKSKLVAEERAGEAVGKARKFQYATEDEHEANVTQNRYLMERAALEPDRLALSGELAQGHIDRYLRHMKDRESFKDEITSTYNGKTQPIAEMAKMQKEEVDRRKEEIAALQGSVADCDKKFFFKGSCREKRQKLVDAAKKDLQPYDEGLTFLNASKARHDRREAQASAAYVQEGYLARLAYARGASEKVGAHTEAVDWMAEAVAKAPDAHKTPMLKTELKDVFVVETARLNRVSNGEYGSASARQAMQDYDKLKTVAQKTGLSMTGQAAMEKRLKERYAEQMKLVCDGTHYFGEYGPYSGALVAYASPAASAGLANQSEAYKKRMRRQACAEYSQAAPDAPIDLSFMK